MCRGRVYKSLLLRFPFFSSLNRYAHSNQPVHNTLFLYGHCGCKVKMWQWANRVISKMYSWKNDGFPGDEDNGEMSAWYILAAIGLFPTCPGDGKYMLLPPHFENVQLQLGAKSEQKRLSRAYLNIMRCTNTANRSQTFSVRLNDVALDTIFVTHDQIMGNGVGAVLQFHC